ncbi:MAG TPA: gamma-glutamylcyclotransferase [Hyphomicrobiales bacterium]|nr:gamma-glutamylcyclotransferase [Rhodobiaceae bacterium]HXK54517.1 gamma-glutamylcyclotransferase [Hyphomicrobiales bacterium]
MGSQGDLWVFGYGSLMWRPDFPHIGQVQATLYGAHRALCVYSHVHRGTPQRPGLVLGLDHGGACRGVCFRVAGAQAEGVIAYLREREQTTLAYREVRRVVRLGDGGLVRALCYVVDRRHPQYSGALDLDTQARLVLQGEGRSGANIDYVLNTVRHLEEMGIADHRLGALANRIGARPEGE